MDMETLLAAKERVLGRVIEAARNVFNKAVHVDGDAFEVPSEPIQELGAALKEWGN